MYDDKIECRFLGLSHCQSVRVCREKKKNAVRPSMSTSPTEYPEATSVRVAICPFCPTGQGMGEGSSRKSTLRIEKNKTGLFCIAKILFRNLQQRRGCLTFFSSEFGFH
ncbi:hypothetical protein CEXT_391601 [Caerostris extrusa]|uniref:Uncharacterized protein n=1 Tax=Caerostris extrusa TaxID=172846 RepID=A0AAV4XGZ7_CAEEX|nr:hypothetical protein CEXT_391601 [Caerostris extrusa]